MKTRDLSVPALLTTVLLWASAFVGIRAVGDTYSPGSLTLGRLVVGAMVLTFFARPRRGRLPTGRPLLLVVLYGVVWFGAYNIALNAAERDIDAGTTALIVNIGPAIAALVAGFLFREGFPRPLVVGMTIAFAGVALIALSTDRDASAVDTASTTGVLLCIAAAFFYAFGTIAQKPALRHMEPVMSVWLGCLVGVVVCLPFAPQLVDELSRGLAPRPRLAGLSGGLPHRDRLQHLVVRPQAHLDRPGRLHDVPGARGRDPHLMGGARRGPRGARLRRRRDVPGRRGHHPRASTAHHGSGHPLTLQNRPIRRTMGS